MDVQVEAGAVAVLELLLWAPSHAAARAAGQDPARGWSRSTCPGTN